MATDLPELDSTTVEVSALLDSPGATRPVDLRVGVPKGFEIPLATLGDVVTISGQLDALVDGVLLRGAVRVDATTRCALCLTELTTDEIRADVAELFTEPSTAEEPEDVEEGYEVVDGTIDVDALIRDALAAAADPSPRCRPDCAGLCPTCGIDRNTGSCACSEEIIDDRWAVLETLELDT